MTDLFGFDDITISEDKNKKDNIVSKINNPKKIKTTKEVSIKSKKLSIPEKLSIITENVDKKLGIYKDSTQV